MPRRTGREAWEVPEDRAPAARAVAAGGLPERLLALQRSAGNAAVARLVQGLARQEANRDQLTLPPVVGPNVLDPSTPLPSVQLTPPSLLQPPAQPGFSPGGWRLLPELQLYLRTLDDELQPQRIRELLRQALTPVVLPPPPPFPPPPWRPVPPPPSPSFPPPAPAPPDRPPGPFDVTPTEPATPGDLLTALASVREIDRLSAQIREQLWNFQRDHDPRRPDPRRPDPRRPDPRHPDPREADPREAEAREAEAKSPTVGRWALVVSGVVIGGSALTGALATPSGRQALAALGGKPLPIPGIPWFKPEFNVQGTNYLLGAHVDVGKYLSGRWGFGPADRGFTPLTPQSP